MKACPACKKTNCGNHAACALANANQEVNLRIEGLAAAVARQVLLVAFDVSGAKGHELLAFAIATRAADMLAAPLNASELRAASRDAEVLK